jgi:tetratricopeptide (TPR) repeat protein
VVVCGPFSFYHGGVKGRLTAAGAAFCILVLAGCAGTPTAGGASDYYDIGNAYVELGQYDKAIDSFQKALRIDPSLVKADFNLALAYAHQKRTADGEAILQRLLKGDPENTQLLSALGWMYHLDGRETDALAQYDAVVALSPSDTDALYNSGIVLWKLDRKTEALSRLKAELALVPDDTDALFSAGSLLLELNQPSDSYDMLSRYLDKKPDDRDALYLVAAGAEAMQKYGRALDAYDKIIAGDASQSEAWFDEARLLLTVVQDPERGLSALSRALSAGFKDAAGVKVLLDTPDLLERDKVEATLKDHGLLPSPAGATAPASSPSSGQPSSGQPSPGQPPPPDSGK